MRGAEIAVGSRFVEGGSTADDWGLFRWLNSRVATLLAWPLTSVDDPMSGFFALRRATFAGGKDWSPVGYKILLECIVKTGARSVVEVPIHFADRAHGESKLSLREQLRYLRHLRRLYTYRFGTWSHFAQFLVGRRIGCGGQPPAAHAAPRAQMEQRVVVALAIVGSMLWNFALNRRFSFSYARGGSVVRQLLGFLGACSVGGIVNYFVTLGTWELFAVKQLAALLGVVAGTGFNFLTSRYLVFRKEHVRLARPRTRARGARTTHAAPASARADGPASSAGRGDEGRQLGQRGRTSVSGSPPSTLAGQAGAVAPGHPQADGLGPQASQPLAVTKPTRPARPRAGPPPAGRPRGGACQTPTASTERMSPTRSSSPALRTATASIRGEPFERMATRRPAARSASRAGRASGYAPSRS